MSILDETSNLLELFMYAAGHSEIPKEWLKWSCLALIAASVADKVWYQKFKWEKMAPNMYIFLVGASGSGKGGAIGFMQQFLHPRMNSYTGSVTYKSMVDLMTRPTVEGGVERSKMFLIQPELADCIGSGQLASSMVKAMTNWYNPSSQDYQESTRMHGEKSFSPPCLTWLAGTTTEWLGESVDHKAMKSGFFGRVAVAPGKYDPSLRVYKPSTPPDYQQVVDYIKDRIDNLTMLKGEFTLTEGAKLLDQEWYETRPEPTVEEFRPFWKRQHDLNLKVAMILSLCESMNLLVQDRHLILAQEMTDASSKLLPPIVSKATSTIQGDKFNQVREYIKANSGVKHSVLLKNMYSAHIYADDLKRILTQFLEEGIIESKRIGVGGQKYMWKGGRQFRPPEG